MLQSAKRSRAEEQYAALQKRDKQALKEKEKALLEGLAKVAKLKELRLAKEVADKLAAEKDAAKKTTGKTKKSKVVASIA